MKDGSYERWTDWYEGRTECHSVLRDPRRVRTECHSVLRDPRRWRTDWQSVLNLLGVLLSVACSSVSGAAEVVRAELGKDTAWTGEAVPLIVTLYSPGPFSGTASFELPELPKTVLVRAGNPVVGSEQVGDESYFTQRHEFAIYTQRAGEVVIPAFLVHFSGKKTFTSAAEPVEGLTPELRFQSTRPPGTEQLGMVVAARNMDVSQTWQPATIGSVQAGDVIARTISRRAEGTTAMMFPPVPIETPEGVRFYATDPIVRDFTERGASRAERSETIKYQFERPRTFQVPDLSVTWWDPDAGELKRETLSGKVVDVRNSAQVAETPAPTPRSRWPLAVLLLTIGLAAWLVRGIVARFLAAQRARRSDPATAAARRLLSACRTNAAAEAYAALLQWKRAVDLGEARLGALLPPGAAAEFEHEWSGLSRHVFGAGPSSSSWSGQRLAGAFARVRRTLGQASRTRCVDSDLPALNPISSHDGDG
ncbi:MAG: protein BatD [Planctomycetes bacterium]|nr:protein BatD [Planctomycetota bacterium]